MKIVLLFSAYLLFFSCKKEVKPLESKPDTIVNVAAEIPVDSHNTKNSLDWQGTYIGETPCADCEGIKTKITLNLDLTFVIQTKYLGKGDEKILEEKGIFIWDKMGRKISLQGYKNGPTQYKVGENQLIQLDEDGNSITGNLAEKYILKK